MSVCLSTSAPTDDARADEFAIQCADGSDVGDRVFTSASRVKKSEQCEMGVEYVLAFIDTYTESPNHQGPSHTEHTSGTLVSISQSMSIVAPAPSSRLM